MNGKTSAICAAGLEHRDWNGYSNVPCSDLVQNNTNYQELLKQKADYREGNKDKAFWGK